MKEFRTLKELIVFLDEETKNTRELQVELQGQIKEKTTELETLKQKNFEGSIENRLSQKKDIVRKEKELQELKSLTEQLENELSGIIKTNQPQLASLIEEDLPKYQRKLDNEYNRDLRELVAEFKEKWQNIINELQKKQEEYKPEFLFLLSGLDRYTDDEYFERPENAGARSEYWNASCLVKDIREYEALQEELFKL